MSLAAISTTALTVLTAVFAEEEGGNLWFMVLIKFVQGAVTAFIPPGLNSISQGIVGAVGMTSQVSTNEMHNHLGTAIIVLSGKFAGSVFLTVRYSAAAGTVLLLLSVVVLEKRFFDCILSLSQYRHSLCGEPHCLSWASLLPEPN